MQFFHLEDSMVLYSIYDSDILEQLIDMYMKCITKQPRIKIICW